MATTIDIQDQVTGALRGLPEELSAGRVNPGIGAAVVKLFQNHFVGLPSNKQGWPSTGFWAGAARATNYNLLVEGVQISVNQQGVRQRYAGGEIKPVEGTYLTIPARAEAYGKRAGEFHNLKLAFHMVGGRAEAWGLVEAPATTFTRGKRKKDGSQKTTTSEVGGLVYFWLVKSVHQNADHSIIPTDDEIGGAALAVVASAVERAMRRKE